VRVGPFLERDEALGARQKLIDSHSLEGVVMSAD
jgi:cell division septation protein DedD